MAGQSRAVASVGVATQVASLQELAYSMNIKKSVSEMTQAEKTYLRYIQLMKSTTHMQGDLGKTMITPANSIRILKNQITLLSRAIGQVLTPIVMEAIPYLMALTNVLTKAAQSLAHALGYELSDVDFSSSFAIEDVNDYSKALDDAGKSAKKAGKSVNESLAPFDELNNVISENSSVGSSKSKGSSGLIDSSIWDEALPQYDMLSKYIDTMKKKAEGLEEVVGKIIGWVTGLLTLGAAVKIINGIAKVITSVKTVWGFVKSIGVAIDNIPNVLAGLPAALQPVATILGGVVAIGTGAITLDKSYDAWHDATRDALESGKEEATPEEYLKVAGGAAGAALGGAAVGAGIGSIIPGLGTAIGTVTGAAIGELSYMLSLWSETGSAVDEYRQRVELGYYELKNYTGGLADWNTTIAKGRSGIFQALDAELGRIDQYEVWANRLKEIVDASGKVKDGYEGEAAVIVDQLNAGLGMNIKLQDNQIKNYGKISKEIDKVIEKKKAEAVINHYADAYAKALMDEKDALKQVHQASDKLKTANEKLKKAKEEGYDPEVIKEMEEEVKNLQTEYDNANGHYYETLKMKETYDDAYKAFAKGNYDEVINIYKNAGDKQYEYAAQALTDMTNEVNGGLGSDLIFAWQKLSEDNQSAYEAGLKGLTPEKRELLLKSIEALKQPAGVIADDTGTLYGSNLVYSVQEYLNDPNHSLKPKIVLPEKIPSNMVGTLQEYADKHGIKINITSGTSPKTILDSFISYFAKNPLKLMTEFRSGNLNGILGLLKIAKFATGGLPTSGDLFFANENGRAEYITSIGNQTAVANQGQMVQVLTNAITAGFNKIQSGNASNVVVYVGDKKLYEGQGEYQNRQNDRYGTTVVRI
jgi:tetratricopeptide (TPR) repeat protein